MTAVSSLAFVPLLLFVSCATVPRVSVETRTLSPVPSGDSGVRLMFNQRIVAGKTVAFLSRAVQPDGSVFYSVLAAAVRDMCVAPPY